MMLNYLMKEESLFIHLLQCSDDDKSSGNKIDQNGLKSISKYLQEELSLLRVQKSCY
jgi:hypothetical protein